MLLSYIVYPGQSVSLLNRFYIYYIAAISLIFKLSYIPS